MAHRFRTSVPGAAAVLLLLTGGTGHAQDLSGTVFTFQPPSTTQTTVQEPGQLPPEQQHTGLRQLFKETARDFKHFPSTNTALILGIGGGLALAVHPIDDDLNVKLSGDGWKHAIWAPGRVIGYGWVQIGGAMGVYTYGRMTNKRGKAVHVGLDLLRAQILTQSMTYAIKGAVGRERPDGSGGSAFPSGHASTTFASAAVLQEHLGWKSTWPTYLVASYVAMSRLHDNRHFASDVVFGAALGMACGKTVVTRHGKSSYAWSPMYLPGGGGITITRVANN